MNRDAFPEVNELVLPYWFFLYDRFQDEISTAYKNQISLSPEESIPLKEFFASSRQGSQRMRDFLERIEPQELETEWIGLPNSGRDVRSFYELTRFIQS